MTTFTGFEEEFEPSPAEVEAARRYAMRSYSPISEEDARLARMGAGTPVPNRKVCPSCGKPYTGAFGECRQCSLNS